MCDITRQQVCSARADGGGQDRNVFKRELGILQIEAPVLRLGHLWNDSGRAEQARQTRALGLFGEVPPRFPDGVGRGDDVRKLSNYQVLSELEYYDLSLKYGEVFKAGIGAEAIRDIFTGLWSVGQFDNFSAITLLANSFSLWKLGLEREALWVSPTRSPASSGVVKPKLILFWP